MNYPTNVIAAVLTIIFINNVEGVSIFTDNNYKFKIREN